MNIVIWINDAQISLYALKAGQVKGHVAMHHDHVEQDLPAALKNYPKAKIMVVLDTLDQACIDLDIPPVKGMSGYAVASRKLSAQTGVNAWQYVWQQPKGSGWTAVTATSHSHIQTVIDMVKKYDRNTVVTLSSFILQQAAHVLEKKISAQTDVQLVTVMLSGFLRQVLLVRGDVALLRYSQGHLADLQGDIVETIDYTKHRKQIHEQPIVVQLGGAPISITSAQSAHFGESELAEAAGVKAETDITGLLSFIAVKKQAQLPSLTLSMPSYWQTPAMERYIKYGLILLGLMVVILYAWQGIQAGQHLYASYQSKQQIRDLKQQQGQILAELSDDATKAKTISEVLTLQRIMTDWQLPSGFLYNRIKPVLENGLEFQTVSFRQHIPLDYDVSASMQIENNVLTYGAVPARSIRDGFSVDGTTLDLNMPLPYQMEMTADSALQPQQLQTLTQHGQTIDSGMIVDGSDNQITIYGYTNHEGGTP